ncbi:glycine--tRNA ligase subunit alpha [Candidatus Nardonella dryophthoridicola]|uniref:glycine--tRNA ligase subunit alpha n=1 Tax=Candidatus Nardonella dryophthoridicola TaxID=1971485 RepID=UPI001AD869FA|nr:glycine--tRNA ligase subunit alpha [Candidatus Nardonella dryophthoridicola]QTJ62886.1 glycine--tRNA ligase subunit alpha [Candidatus Nardonella dryophthoridicola]
MCINKNNSIYNIINNIKNFWIEKNNFINIMQYDSEVGAGTFHPLIFFNSIKLNPLKYIYIQKSRRPQDSKFSITKLYNHIQLQVIIYPSYNNIQELYINSLDKIGINKNNYDIKFLDDNWKNPTLLAWGIGNEVQINGIEITQITNFMYIGGIKCNGKISEITYGIERISSILQNSDINNLVWDYSNNNIIYYKDIFLENFNNYDMYNSNNNINCNNILNINRIIENEIEFLLNMKNPLVFVAYDYLLKIINNFNILDSRLYFSNFYKKIYISKIQNILKKIVKKYLKNNEK